MPCYACVRLGQTPPLVIVGLVAALLFLEPAATARGVALAWAVVDPQLAVVAVPAALLWACRRSRSGRAFRLQRDTRGAQSRRGLDCARLADEMLRAGSHSLADGP